MDADEMAREFRALNLTPLLVEAEVGADFIATLDKQTATLLRRYAASRLREAAGKLRERHAPASDIDAYFADWLAERAAAEERG